MPSPSGHRHPRHAPTASADSRHSHGGQRAAAATRSQQHHQHQHQPHAENGLLLDVSELERRPGTLRTYHVDASAPADLGTAVLGVPEASPLTIDLRLESVAEGIVATGTAAARVAGECVRCLDPIANDVEVEFQELYVYPESDAAEDEAQRLDGDHLDLEPAVRDALVLSLPFQPTCQDDCPGLCPECGAKLADDPAHTHAPAVDPRWAALSELADPHSREP
jgi:uncharacterized protein